MNLGRFTGMLVATTLGIACSAQTSVPPPPVTVQDCTKLKGSAKKDCLKTNTPAATSAPAAKNADPFPFPEDASRGRVKGGTADMPSGEPDPPAESLKPMHVPGADADPPAASGASSSSSSSDGLPALPPPDDDAAPTTSGSDTPIRPGTLKDLGSRGDSSAARQKLEQTRVDDDLRVGHYYFKDGNYAGATARYQDALSHDTDNPDAHFGLAEVLLKQNKPAEAMAHLERYLQLAPDDDHTKEAQKLLAKLKH